MMVMFEGGIMLNTGVVEVDAAKHFSYSGPWYHRQASPYIAVDTDAQL